MINVVDYIEPSKDLADAFASYARAVERVKEKMLEEIAIPKDRFYVGVDIGSTSGSITQYNHGRKEERQTDNPTEKGA